MILIAISYTSKLKNFISLIKYEDSALRIVWKLKFKLAVLSHLPHPNKDPFLKGFHYR